MEAHRPLLGRRTSWVSNEERRVRIPQPPQLFPHTNSRPATSANSTPLSLPNPTSTSAPNTSPQTTPTNSAPTAASSATKSSSATTWVAASKSCPTAPSNTASPSAPSPPPPCASKSATPPPRPSSASSSQPCAHIGTTSATARASRMSCCSLLRAAMDATQSTCRSTQMVGRGGWTSRGWSWARRARRLALMR